MLVLDVDRFKRVNDTLGHSSGDELIVKLGRLLRSSLRETDVVGRWGGDEFTVLLPQASEEEAMAVATRLLRRVREEVTVAGGEALLPFTVSIGVTPFGEGIVPEPGQILRSADAAMYQAKAAGRDRVGRSELGWKRAEGDRVEASDEPGRRAAPGR